MEYIYGALLLHKLGQPVTEDNLRKVITATGTQVDDSKIKTLIASLQGVDITSELENASIAISSGNTGQVAEETKVEEKKEEKKAEAAEGLASLFG
ncbi:MAG: 50S ribosomal protein L12 [Candidatus Pacearchaeota archaeon]|nr:50S ribosomal protein L12 [Candidatus Pacearchaeota archaeon]